jgi:sodium pump decarboxylase gamma subunit
MVTLLGFLIVITLLLVLILVLLLFGKIMANKPQPETPNKWDAPKPEAPSPFSKQVPEADATVAAIAMALAAAQSDDEAAIAMALHLYYNGVHDIQETRLTMVGQSTAWNAKSFGMNNIGF